MIQVGLFLLFCTGALAAVPGFSGAHCSNVTGIPNFNATQFKGLWFEIEKSLPTLFNARKCVSVIYTPLQDGSIEAVFWLIRGKSNQLTPIVGRITITSQEPEARLIARFPNTCIPDKEYVIVEIDYENYFISFTCTNGANDVAIFSRQSVLSAHSQKKVDIVLKEYNLRTPPLKKYVQTNCPGFV